MKTDDPRLTAYALDELPADERAEIEALLARDPALASEIEATRAFAAQLRTELKDETSAPLSDVQRAEVLASQPASDVPVAKITPMTAHRSWWMRRAPLALAASIALCAGATVLFGVLSYMDAKARIDLAAIADPGPWQEPDVFTRFAIRVGDKLTGSDVANELGAAGASESQRLADAASGTVMAQIRDAAPLDGVQWQSQPGMARVLDPNQAQAGQGKVPFTLYPGSGPVSIAEPAVRESMEKKEVVELTKQLTHNAGSLTASAGFGGAFRAEGTVMKDGAGQLTLSPATPAADAPAPTPTLAAAPVTTSLGKAFAENKSGSRTWTASGAITFTGRTSTLNGGALAGVPLEQETVGGLPGLNTPLPKDEMAAAQKAKSEGNTEAYDAITDNAFLAVKDQPLSTFSIDVDTASYANVRRFLTSGTRPPRGAVRIEEMLNYFSYDYPQPAGDAPFSATMEVAACPWAPEHRLVRIGLKGKDVARSERPAANLVFLIDVSGSMQPANKLPLVKESLRLLIDQLDDRDLVAIAVYAGASGTVLEPTRDKAKMRAALDRLEAGGSTNGAGGIQLAYELAARSFIKGGTNRVILATDGDFNVGMTSQSDLVELIEKKAKGGVFLSVLGYGMGNLKDSTLEKLADKGNGNYGYIDTLAEAKKTLVEQMNGTLHTIAKDVKIQVEFNPAQAAAYRLIGYENRVLAKEDFNDDRKDAGEIGAGHNVTALYEVVPAGGAVPGASPAADELKYSAKPVADPTQESGSSPGEWFVTAYTFTQQAEQAEAVGDTAQALARNREAKAILDKIAKQNPDWKPEIVAFRVKRTAESIARLEKLLPSSAPAADQSAIHNPQSATPSPELLTLKLRYKKPDGDVSTKLEFPLTDRGETWEKSSSDFRWAAAVASFGMLLRDSPHKGAATWDSTLELAHEGRGDDRAGYRAECLALIEKARTIAR